MTEQEKTEKGQEETRRRTMRHATPPGENHKFVKNDQYFTVCIYTFVLVVASALAIKAIVSFDQTRVFFGGLVTALAFIMDRPELVLFFGLVYIWDALTVVIQRVYFKATHGKRIFKMTPIHHAFEMRGWREVKIDGFFALIAAVGVALGILYICLV